MNYSFSPASIRNPPLDFYSQFKKRKTMKLVKFFTTISLTAGIIFFSSCNSGKDKEADKPAADSTGTKTEATTVTSPSGPTNVMTVKHKVANYASWKPGYDAHDSARLANGLHSYLITRGVEDTNMVMVAMIMDNVDKAKAMAAAPELKDVMKKAGVMGTPEIDYIEAVMNDTTAIQQTVRLMIKAKVKDWDAWKKVFDAHKQTRMDAGLTDRVIAHTIGDNHMVTLVFAVADMDKAKAFLGSKDLKDRMAESGVEGPPNIFFYNVVAKY